MSVMKWKLTPFWPEDGEKGKSFRRVARRLEERDWKKFAMLDMEEVEEVMGKVFIVMVDERYNKDSTETHVVGDGFFTTYQRALDEIHYIADDFDVDIPDDATYLKVYHEGDEQRFDVYYIIELENLDG